jgi:hypothetical protein
MLEQRYDDNVKRAVEELYDHMDNNLLGWLSDDGEYSHSEDLTPEQLDSISAVQAIEEEWVLDPELREEVSMLRFAADDNDTEKD